MELNKTTLENVFLIKPQIFEDHRGEYVEVYNEDKFNKALLSQNLYSLKFIEDDISIAHHHCLKGIHGDTKTWKLISCSYGKIYVIVVNCDTESKQYGQWESFILSDKNRYQILVPPKHGNGHVCLSDMSIFSYKQTSYYDPTNQFTIKWNEEWFKFWWPIKNPIVSKRDEAGDNSLRETSK